MLPLALNGHPLNNAPLGWTVLRATERHAAHKITRTELTTPRRDGSTPLPGVEATPAQSITVGTEYRSLATLRTLLTQQTLNLTDSNRPGSADVELASIGFNSRELGDTPYTEVTFSLAIPGLFFRGPVVTTQAALTNGAVPLTAFPGLTGRVDDAVVRITGPASNPVISDAGGSGTWISYRGDVATGQTLRIDTATGRAWLAGDTWTGGTEVDSTLISMGPSRYFLRITPTLSSTLASTRGAVVVETTARGSGAAAEIRGRNAFLA